MVQIESDFTAARGKRSRTFKRRFLDPQSDLAQQLIKDTYNFDFLTLTKEAHERDLARELVLPLRQFLIELGVGFAFVGSEVPPLEVGEKTSSSISCSITSSFDVSSSSRKTELSPSMRFGTSRSPLGI